LYQNDIIDKEVRRLIHGLEYFGQGGTLKLNQDLKKFTLTSDVGYSCLSQRGSGKEIENQLQVPKHQRQMS
jgi:hypothetical protein